VNLGLLSDEVQDEGVAVLPVLCEVQSGIHEGGAVVFDAVVVHVNRIGIQTLQFEEVNGMNGGTDDNEGSESLRLVFADIHPCGAVTGLAVDTVGRHDETVQITLIDYVVVAVVCVNLLAHQILFFIGQLGQVKFVAECTRHCHIAAGHEGGLTSDACPRARRSG